MALAGFNLTGGRKSCFGNTVPIEIPFILSQLRKKVNICREFF
jgi:hypothetical protein